MFSNREKDNNVNTGQFINDNDYIIMKHYNQYLKIDNFRDFVEKYSSFYEGKQYACFTHQGPLYHESISYSKYMRNMLYFGFVTIGSQPGHNEDLDTSFSDEHTCRYGFGYISGFLHKDVFKVIFLEKMLPKDIIILVEDNLIIDNNEVYMEIEEEEISISVLGTDDRMKCDLLNDQMTVSKKNRNVPSCYRHLHCLHTNVCKYIMMTHVPVLFIHKKVGDNELIKQVHDVIKKASYIRFLN
jgi:hypothetical protein